MSDDFMDMLSGEGAKPQKPDQEEGGMGDLLGSLLGGGGDAGGLGALLGGLMGGGGGDASAAPGGDEGDMAGMLGSLLGGASGSAQSGGGSADLLGSLLGGASDSSAPQQSGGSGDLLGSLMGGGGGAGGLGGMLGGLLGGGGGGSPMSFGGGGGGASLPFAGTLAKKLGISEQMANMLLMGAIGLLTSSMAKNRSASRSGQIDVNSLTDADFIRSSGVSGRLSSQMGVSEDEAILGLQRTMEMMVAQNAGSAPAPAKKKRVKKSATTAEKPAAAKKKATKSEKSTPKKKQAKKDTGTDFMGLLDDQDG